MADTLKEFVESCDDADTLREIAKEKFGTTIHNRTSLEKTKAKVIELIDADLAELEGGTEGDEPDQSPANKTEARMLKNKRTGNVFAWTKALAKNKNMVEV